MKATGLLVVIAVALIAAVHAATDPNNDPPNTRFSLEWQSNKYGPFKVFQAGVGLGGFDVNVCKPETTRTLRLPWSTYANTVVKKAFLIWQAESNLTPVQYELTLDGVPMMAEAKTLSSGTECNHLTNDHSTVLARSDVYYADVTDKVWGKLNDTVGSVDFAIVFTTTCADMELANGVSLIVVGKNLAWSAGQVVKIKVGGVAYDKNSANHIPAVFQFSIPKTGILEGERLDNLELSLGLVVGEGEVQSGEEPEGYRVNNGVFVPLALDGTDGTTAEDGPKWDTKLIEIYDCDTLTTTADQDSKACITDTATQVSVAFQSQKDCLIFVALVLEYEVNFNESFVDIAEDPHITTWDGLKTTLFAEGDYVMMESRKTGLAVHTRFAKNRRGPWAPWTTAVAARCTSNSGFVELNAESFDSPKIVGQGVLVNKISDRIQQIQCETTGLVLTAMRFRFHRMNYINLRIEKTASLPKDLTGLLGSPNGKIHDDLASREGLRYVHEGKAKGHFLGHTISELTVIQNSWRVLEKEKLFSTPFIAAESPKGITTHAIGQLSRADAKRECLKAGVVGQARMLACIHDATMTGSNVGAKNMVEWMAAMGELHGQRTQAGIAIADKAGEFGSA